SQPALDRYLTARRLQLFADDPHEGGLAGAVRSGEAITFAVVEGHVDPLEEHPVSEVHGNVANGKHLDETLIEPGVERRIREGQTRQMLPADSRWARNLASSRAPRQWPQKSRPWPIRLSFCHGRCACAPTDKPRLGRTD